MYLSRNGAGSAHCGYATFSEKKSRSGRVLSARERYTKSQLSRRLIELNEFREKDTELNKR